jgi:hypothetical protein
VGEVERVGVFKIVANHTLIWWFDGSKGFLAVCGGAALLQLHFHGQYLLLENSLSSHYHNRHHSNKHMALFHDVDK